MYTIYIIITLIIINMIYAIIVIYATIVIMDESIEMITSKLRPQRRRRLVCRKPGHPRGAELSNVPPQICHERRCK